MTAPLKALDEIESALKDALEATLDDDVTSALRPIEQSLEALPTLRAALAPVADGEVDAIRQRHEEIEAGNFAGFFYDAAKQEQAHTDRATLLAHVYRLSAELAFYADPANHIGHRDPSARVYIETSAVEADGGKRARAALSQEAGL